MTGETQLTIVGNVVADPELRFTQNGLAVVNLTIASTPRVFDRTSNDWKDGEPLFMRATAWREFAENISASITKGTRVVATGNLRQKPYETREGEKRTSWEMDLEELAPSLKYATAQVTRVQSGSRTQDRNNAGRGQQEEPWAQSAPSDSGDVWNTPGTYDGEQPF